MWARPCSLGLSGHCTLGLLRPQVFANIAIVITTSESPAVRDWFTWRDIWHVLDIVCCLAILLPIAWQIKRLSETSETDGKAARSLEKLTLFRSFYVAVVAYIYFTRIVGACAMCTCPPCSALRLQLTSSALGRSALPEQQHRAACGPQVVGMPCHEQPLHGVVALRRCSVPAEHHAGLSPDMGRLLD